MLIGACNFGVYTIHVPRHRDIQPHMDSCVQGLEGAADMVDSGADVEAFKTLTKTGNLPEQAIRPAGDVTVQQIHHKRVSKNKIFKTTSRKKDAIREDFGNLPYVLTCLRAYVVSGGYYAVCCS